MQFKSDFQGSGITFYKDLFESKMHGNMDA